MFLQTVPKEHTYGWVSVQYVYLHAPCGAIQGFLARILLAERFWHVIPEAILSLLHSQPCRMTG